MINAKSGISSMNISRDIGVTYKTAWYSAMRVRCAMLDWGEKLEGIVEMDETYVGGKPRKRNGQKGVTEANTADLSTVYNLESTQVKRGRGTKKVPVAGIVQRKGNVVAKVMDNLTSKELMKMLQRAVNIKNSTLMTDDFKSYKQMDEVIERFVINHSAKEYSRGAIHTNTIEGFWSIIKNGIRGQYRVLSKKYLPFYLAEFCYRYNRRQLTVSENFNEVVEDSVENEKKFNAYKPMGNVRRIVYPPSRKVDVDEKEDEEIETEPKKVLTKRVNAIIRTAKKEQIKKNKATALRKKKLAAKRKAAKKTAVKTKVKK